MFAARDKVCEEFAKYRNVTSQSSVKELINQGWEAQNTLSQLVVQMEKVEADTYKINIRDENYKFENNPFRYFYFNSPIVINSALIQERYY